MMEITNHIPRMQKTSQDLTLIIDTGDNYFLFYSRQKQNCHGRKPIIFRNSVFLFLN
jgi:hypothetical protein